MNLNVNGRRCFARRVSIYLGSRHQQWTGPSFSKSAPPQLAESLYLEFIAQAKAQNITTECGEFGAHMQVELTNNGPVTFWLHVQ